MTDPLPKADMSQMDLNIKEFAQKFKFPFHIRNWSASYVLADSELLNDWEKTLGSMKPISERLPESFKRCGTFYSGEMGDIF